MKSKIFAHALLLLAFLSALLAVPGSAVRAADPTGQDLIDAVNALRAGKGLPAYTFDATLNDYAQAQADYMASTGTLTHTRPDGSVPWGSGLKENIAYGQTLTPAIAVSQIWTDDLHYAPMVLPGGAVGAGVARSGDALYFSLVVRPSGAAVSTQAAVAQAQTTQQATAMPTLAIAVTVNADGSIKHLVQSGDTLTSIALLYGVSVADLKKLNDIGDNNIIFLNTYLLIRAANTATPTPEPSATPSPETPTLTLSATVEAPTATLQPSPTPQPTPAGFFAGVPGFFTKNLGGLIVGGMLGLALGFFLAQFGRRR